MFSKLKDKLKSTLSIFSKKAEEEATEESVEIEKEVEQVKKTKEVEEKVAVTPISKESKKKEEAVTDEEIAPPPSKDKLLDLGADELVDSEEHITVAEKKEEIILDQVEKIIEKPKKEHKSKEETSQKSKLPSVHDLLSEELVDDEDDKAPVKQKLTKKEKEEIKEEEKVALEPSKGQLLDQGAGEAADIEVSKQAAEKEEKFITKIAKEALKEKPKKVETVKTEVKEKVIAETKKEPVTEEKKGLFSKIKQKLTTKTINSEKFEELFWDLELVLLENNVSVKVIEKLKSNLSAELVDKPLPRDVASKIQEVLASTLREILSIEKKDIIAEIKEAKANGKPYSIIFFGINGSGKTTTIAKLAHKLKTQGFSVVLAAGDTFRAAAIHQLEDHANKLEVKMIKHDYGSDAAAVAYDAVAYAKKNNIDVVLIDTAGRLHSNTNLMAELEKIMRVAEPDCKIFIGESITGNDCVEQAEKYTNTLGIDGIILTKADIDEMGGAPLSICYVTGKPILYLGMGQEYKDLVPFSADLILERLGIE
ncbi:signal recognition particle-docking protein FtsY [archaeon]|nr:signal recognition particle-docking protein FtsY [archaeon]